MPRGFGGSPPNLRWQRGGSLSGWSGEVFGMAPSPCLASAPVDLRSETGHARGQFRSKARQSDEVSATGLNGETSRRLNHPLENPGTVGAGGTGTPAIGPHAMRICALLTYGQFGNFSPT